MFSSLVMAGDVYQHCLQESAESQASSDGAGLLRLCLFFFLVKKCFQSPDYTLVYRIDKLDQSRRYATNYE